MNDLPGQISVAGRLVFLQMGKMRTSMLQETPVRSEWKEAVSDPSYAGRQRAGLVALSALRNAPATMPPSRQERTFRTVATFAAGGVLIAVLGALLLMAMVRAGVRPLIAQAIQLAVTLALNFAYNYKVTWRNRPRANLVRQVTWFLATRGATQAASWAAFAELTAAGVQYEVANALTLAGAMLVNFVTSDKLVFRAAPAAAVEASARPITAVAPSEPKARWLPLALILAVLAVLSARLIPTGIASHDEALYIYSGHQLIYELWHGGGSPFYETFFSGAPVLYPVMAAMADQLGGLAAVRLMSDVFMLTATLLLYLTARRLFGYLPAIFAAGLFAGLGITQDLGAYATYDALSIMFIGAAAYSAARTAHWNTGWLLAIPGLLLLANAAAYSTLPFDGVVILIAALRHTTWRGSARRIGALGLAVTCELVLAIALAGTAYLKGVMFTVVARHGGNDSVLGSLATPGHVIISETWAWTGMILVLGGLAVIVALLSGESWYLVAVIVACLLVGLLITITALRLHTDESMTKHDDIGIWFSCIAAGYALAASVRWPRRRWVQAIGVTLVSAFVVLTGIHYSRIAPVTYQAQPNTQFLAAFRMLRPYLNHPGDRFLVGGQVENVMPYTDGISVPWWNYDNDVYIKYPLPGRGGDSHGQDFGRICYEVRPGCVYLEGAAAFRAAIHAHWFALISMIGNHGINQDAVILRAVKHTPGYILLTRLGGAPTWIYAPAYQKMPR
jgi:putative flippase GtrA